MSTATLGGWELLARRTDCEAAAVLTILGQDWARPKAIRFLNDGGIDFAGMLGVCEDDEHEKAPEDRWSRAYQEWEPCRCITGAPYWSSSERALIALAANLWNSSNDWVNPARLLDVCDNGMLRLALDAIAARCGGSLPGYTAAPR